MRSALRRFGIAEFASLLTLRRRTTSGAFLLFDLEITIGEFTGDRVFGMIVINQWFIVHRAHQCAYMVVSIDGGDEEGVAGVIYPDEGGNATRLR